MYRTFHRVLIANRGEIVSRIARTARRLGLETVAVYADPDVGAPHLGACDVSLPIGGDTPASSYLDAAKILEAARRSGADALHPGYGFLSEDPAFARAVEEAGLVFVGPPVAAMAAMGDKALARRRMAEAGVPVLPGYDDEDQSPASFATAAIRIGFPVMIKASAGGGGRGMRRVASAADLLPALESAASEARSAFGNPRLILERALDAPRHVEVQVFGDSHGHLVALGDRDCSIQRRHQKIIEEAPAPGLSTALRVQLATAAVMAARAVSYSSAGTVEFLVSGERCYFMEMNTRLQVEHPVTEAVTGVDLVEWQFRVARGEPLPCKQEEIVFHGHAIEARLCAEDPANGFLPGGGRVELWRAPAGVRVDHALATGAALPPEYDSMAAKVIAHGESREAAHAQLERALRATVLFGMPTNRAFLAKVLAHPAFASGAVSTAFIEEHFPVASERTDPPGDVAWAAAAQASASPPPGVPLAWQWFTSTGTVELPVRLAWGSDIRAGRLMRDAGGNVRVAWAGHITKIDPLAPTVVHRAGSRIYVQTAEGDWAFEDLRLEAESASASGVPASGRVVSPMNGRVVAVAVFAGATVARGQPLVTLEAMKMEHVLVAPVAGVVAAVHVAAGAQAVTGKLLLEITPAA